MQMHLFESRRDALWRSKMCTDDKVDGLIGGLWSKEVPKRWIGGEMEGKRLCVCKAKKTVECGEGNANLWLFVWVGIMLRVCLEESAGGCCVGMDLQGKRRFDGEELEEIGKRSGEWCFGCVKEGGETRVSTKPNLCKGRRLGRNERGDKTRLDRSPLIMLDTTLDLDERRWGGGHGELQEGMDWIFGGVIWGLRKRNAFLGGVGS